MTEHTDTLRDQVAAALARVPDPDEPGADLGEVAARLAEAHAILARALDAVEKS